MIFSKEQDKVFEFNKKNMIVSASAGAGKTTTMIEFITRLIEKGVPIKRMLVLTFTKAAASEMKDRLSERLLTSIGNDFVNDQIDELMTSDISTIHSFLEKMIKRNISHLPELEGFVMLDEKQTSKLMSDAFEEACQQFKNSFPQEYENLFFTIRNLKEIKDIIFTLHSFMSAQSNRESLLEFYEKNFMKSFNLSCEYIKNQIITDADEITEKIKEFLCDNEKVANYFSKLDESLTLLKYFSIKDLEKYSSLPMPRQPILKDYDKAQDVIAIKEKTIKLFKKVEKLALLPKKVWDGEQTEILTKQIYNLFKIFDKLYCERKIRKNALDFNDLEWQSEILLSNPVLLEEMQEKFDYVFIDEYQDTNTVQEKLVKAIGAKGRFVGIGDPKQGIYAFRNATAKIILNDSKNFEKSEDGQTVYLTDNYRSNSEILDFVNSIFSKIMTLKTTGIDYKNTSILKGKKQVQHTERPIIQVDVVKKHKIEKRQWPEGYNIFDDPLVSEENALIESQVVAMRIEEFLMSEFTDPETKEKRKVMPSDIAVLARGKSEIVDAVMNQLQVRQIPFVSTLKTNITEKSYIKLLVAMLNLCVNRRDDQSLASYLLSPFVRATPDLLALLMHEKTEPFWKVMLESENEIVKKAILELDVFKKECYFYGAKRAFENIFVKSNFYSYLFCEFGTNAVKDVDSFLFVIASFDDDKDIPELLAYVGDDVAISSSATAEAVTISTIHSSKGLEYPIVILIGAGKPMINPDTSNFKINAELGLALSFYDHESFQRFTTPVLLVEKELAKSSERIDELMILYVALTRAKSHLVVTGTFDPDKVEEYDGQIEKFNSYMSLILSTCEGAVVNEIDKIETYSPKEVSAKISAPDHKMVDRIKDYVDFQYPYEEETHIKQKTSVSELSFETSKHSNLDTSFSETGTAYHEALKILDFSLVNTSDDVVKQFNEKKFDENMQKLIDINIVYENIKLLKPIIYNKKIFKEKPFVLKLENKQLVQGIVDLLATGDENILIDYKFTREKDENVLKNRYKEQIMLYKEAIEKAENIKINKIFLVSLLNKKIINF